MNTAKKGTVVMAEVKVADKGSDVVLVMTPVDETGKINGEVIRIRGSQPAARYVHATQSYVLGLEPADRVQLLPRAVPATEQFGIRAGILRDVCELAPADIESEDTIIVSTADLLLIIDRHLAQARAPDAAARVPA